MRFFSLMLILLVTLTCAAALTAATESPPSLAPNDVILPGSIGAVVAALIWAAKKVTATIESTSARSEVLINRLLEALQEALGDTRESRQAMDASRRTFAAHHRIPTDTSPINQRHKPNVRPDE